MSERDFLLFAGVFDSNADARKYFLTDWSLGEPKNQFHDELGVVIDEDFCELHDTKLTIVAEIKMNYADLDINDFHLDRFTHYFLVGRYAIGNFDEIKERLSSPVVFSYCQMIF